MDRMDAHEFVDDIIVDQMTSDAVEQATGSENLAEMVTARLQQEAQKQLKATEAETEKQQKPGVKSRVNGFKAKYGPGLVVVIDDLAVSVAPILWLLLVPLTPLSYPGHA